MILFAKAVGAWIVILFISINLLGFVVRGFFVTKPEFNELAGNARELLEREAKRGFIVDNAMTILGAIALVAFVGALAYYWNMALALVAVLSMLSRLPDLLWEIKNGRKISKSDSPGVLNYIAVAIMFLCFPLTWFALSGS